LRSRLRYTTFASWCDWHLPATQNISSLGKSKRLHACHSCRQAQRICAKFPNKVIAAEISLNCSNGNSNLDPTAEFSVVCDDASDTTLCTVRSLLAAPSRHLHAKPPSGHESIVCAQRGGPAVRQARHFRRVLQLGLYRPQQHQQWAEIRRDSALRKRLSHILYLFLTSVFFLSHLLIARFSRSEHQNSSQV
jgi:hypothetical protein